MNHSPIGLGNTVFNTIQYLQSGTDASTRAPVHLQKAVSHLAMSLTGSAISLLGMAAFGWVL